MPTSTEPEGMPAWLPGDLPQDPPAATPPAGPPATKPPAGAAPETGADIPAEIRADAPAEVLPLTPAEVAAEAAADAPGSDAVAEAQALESAPHQPEAEAEPEPTIEPEPPAPDDESAVGDPQALEAAVDLDAEVQTPVPSAVALDDEDAIEPDAEELAAAFIIDGDGSENVDALADLLGGDEALDAEVVVLVADEADDEAHADVLIAAPDGATTEDMVVDTYETGEAEPVMEEEVQQSGPAPDAADDEAREAPAEPAEAAQEAVAVLEALADGTLPEAEASEEAADAPEDVLIAAPETASEPVAEAAAPVEPPAEPAPAKGRKRGKRAKPAEVKAEGVIPAEAVAAGANALADVAQAAQNEPAPDFQPVSDASLTDMTPLGLEAQLEALLFVADGATPVARLAEALEVHPREVESALTMLGESYRHRGLSLQRFRDKVQLTTAPAAAGQVERFLGLAAATPLSRAALEALAIIAYQQPVTRPQIEAVRGVNSDSVIKNLLSKGLVEEGGRAEGPGRPVLYSTTPEFMQHFGIATLSDLPPLTLPEAAPTGLTADELLKG